LGCDYLPAFTDVCVLAVMISSVKSTIDKVGTPLLTY